MHGLGSTIIDCHDGTWCYLRSAVVGVLALITGFFCIYQIRKIVKLLRHSGIPIRTKWYAITALCVAAIHCLILVVHEFFASEARLEFTVFFLKYTEFLVVVYHFVNGLFFQLEMEKVRRWVVRPCASTIGVYFFVTYIVCMVSAENTHITCLSPYWLVISGSGFVLSVIFIATAFVISRRLRRITFAPQIKSAHTQQLWILVSVFFATTLIGLIYDIILYEIVTIPAQCDSFGASLSAAADEMVTMIMRILDLLVPVWAMLYVFFCNIIRSSRRGGVSAAQLRPSGPTNLRDQLLDSVHDYDGPVSLADEPNSMLQYATSTSGPGSETPGNNAYFSRSSNANLPTIRWNEDPTLTAPVSGASYGNPYSNSPRLHPQYGYIGGGNPGMMGTGAGNMNGNMGGGGGGGILPPPMAVPLSSSFTGSDGRQHGSLPPGSPVHSSQVYRTT